MERMSEDLWARYPGIELLADGEAYGGTVVVDGTRYDVIVGRETVDAPPEIDGQEPAHVGVHASVSDQEPHLSWIRTPLPRSVALTVGGAILRARETSELDDLIAAFGFAPDES